MTVMNDLQLLRSAIWSSTRKERRLILTRPFALRRKFHAFCVGTPKSGTVSIAGIFSKYRSSHEPLHHFYLWLALEAAGHGLDRQQTDQALRLADAYIYSEMSSSNVQVELLESLLDIFPESQFIFTIRDCYTWLDSIVNHDIGRLHEQNPTPTRVLATRLMHIRYQFDTFPHPDEERILYEHGVYSLDGYLSHWASHNQKVLDLVPPERLLIVRTHEIQDSIQRLADFLTIDSHTLDHTQAHSHKKLYKNPLLTKIDHQYLESKFDRHCRGLMDRFFPEITFADAALKEYQTNAPP